jgi:ABC-type branched-subunit amino acid transport system ATPase component
MLEIRGLSKSFGGVNATDNVSLDPADGSLIAVIGPNGAGKSMTMKAILGLAPRAAARSAATILIAEQNMHFCLGLASHATVIDEVQIVYTSSIEELKANDNIRQRYRAL